MNGRVLEVAKLLVKEILRKKDFYVALVVTALLLGYAASLRFYGISSASRYLLDLGLALSFFFGVFLTVSLAARQFPNELRDKTLHVLLARPISRFEYLFGKFLGAWFAGSVASAAFFMAVVLSTAFKAGDFSWWMAVETFVLFVLGLGILTALATTLSLVLTAASTVCITTAFYVLVSIYGFYWGESARQLTGMARPLSLALYFIVPHFEFFDLRQRFVHGWPSPPVSVLFFLVGYAFFYCALFLLIGRRILERKSIS